MITEYEINKINALALSKLILDNPNTRVIAWISSDGISDEYGSWGGNIGKPEKKFIAYSQPFDHYIEKDGDIYEDCYAYYGLVSDNWDDDTMKQKAKEIPWEEVIAVNVSAM